MGPRLLAISLVALAAACDGSDPSDVYRLRDAQEVPGSVDWSLLPPDDVRPAIGPGEAFRELPGAGEEPEVTVALGRAENRLDGSVGPTAWLFVTPHLCFATAKGDLVSPGRFGDGDPCTDDNLYIQGVDAVTGEVLGGFTAFRPPGGWTFEREGEPQPVVVTTQDGTTRLN
jgi:hypothetical protein